MTTDVGVSSHYNDDDDYDDEDTTNLDDDEEEEDLHSEYHNYTSIAVAQPEQISERKLPGIPTETTLDDDALVGVNPRISQEVLQQQVPLETIVAEATRAFEIQYGDNDDIPQNDENGNSNSLNISNGNDINNDNNGTNDNNKDKRLQVIL